MTNKDNYLYPVTPATLHKYAEDIFAPIRRGECVTTVWVPMSGRRMWNKFIIENIQLFEKELPYFNKYLLIYIEPLDLTEESLAGYIRLLAKSFIDVCKKNKESAKNLTVKDIEIYDDPNVTYSKLLESLKYLLRKTTDSGLDIVFFVGEFDELDFANTIFYNNLKSLWSQLYPRLHYVFLMREIVTGDEKQERWGDFNEAILQNIVYVPLLKDIDFSYVVDRLKSQYSVETTQDQVVIFKELCGGHPYMIKVCFRVLQSHNSENLNARDLKNILYDHYELKSVARGVLEVLNPKQKELLKKIALGDKIVDLSGEELKSLAKLGFLTLTSSGNYEPFGELFEMAIKRLSQKENYKEKIVGNLEIDSDTQTILLGEKPIEEQFTPQEYSILVMLLTKKGKIASRDDIGEVLWGKESYEKYSDWAIDQLMSKLRKKLTKLDTKEKLVTVRGKGYKLLESTI